MWQQTFADEEEGVTDMCAYVIFTYGETASVLSVTHERSNVMNNFFLAIPGEINR